MVRKYLSGGTGGKGDDQGKISGKLSATCTQWQGEALNRLDRIREAASLPHLTRGRSRMN